jgi:branched-chain amino acid transport system substrate-binding protein
LTEFTKEWRKRVNNLTFNFDPSSGTDLALSPLFIRKDYPMGKIISRTCAALVFFILLGGGTGCNNQSKATSSLKIGMLAPLTGSGARFGESQRNGVQIAIDEINAAGGVEGKTLELVLEDTKTEPPTAVTAFLRMTQRKDIVALFGSAASLDVPAYLPQVDAAEIPHLLPVAVLPQITEKGSRWTFRNALNDKIAAQKMAHFLTQKLQAKKVAFLIEDSAFGETGLICREELERLGVTAVTTERFKRGELDMRPQLTKIRSLGTTHVQFWGYYAEYAIVAKQMRELGSNAVLLGNQAPVNEKTLELGGEALEGAFNICLFVPTSSSQEIREFVAKYKARFTNEPDTWAAQSYDGMKILADAMKRGGTTRQGIRDSLAATRDFPGITGSISFSDTGDGQFRETSIVRVHQGRFVPYMSKTKE